ncbi:putative Undecaprenyl-phosphate alpha-N-acetylglucosaminyl 1-phosphate transferase [Nitrospira sp. KM1]|uniref:glycosyltransferase family 4 protein n=1 Tax=Nitrospira sp. KM1 TaxID=1936990 RepID=UPI0013A752A5|nr:MraY family glycosyltransferase [Nitrospira sp. KM1]BCA57132.1 putative Undecaprenyl-phosphate alpha-N-acetylglucosaminyl 1-phosphate transferase [Nitrospira sp. KM1]
MATAFFFSFLGSLIICMALIPPLMASAGRLQVLDVPGGRKAHSGSVAKVGGIALATGTFIGVLMWAPKDDVILASLLGGLIILLFGIWDDRVGLTYSVKFAGQALAAFIVLAVGGVHVSSLPMIPDSWMTPWVSLPFTFLTLIAVTNAVNLADGLDGLAGGLSLISFAATAILAFQMEDSLLMLMVVSVLGGLLGFLRFNTYPARVFMGDAGSQFLGFYLGVTALVLTDPSHGPYSPMTALFIWGLPVLDMFGVMIQRWHEGRSPFIGDRNHLHHRLLSMGWSHREAVMLIYAVQTGLVTLAYTTRWQPDWVLMLIYLVVAACVLIIYIRPVDRLMLHARSADTMREDGRAVAWRSNYPGLAQLPIRLLAVVVPGFLIVSVGLPQHIPFDAGLVAAGLLAALVCGMRLWPRSAPFLVRAGLYVGSTFVLYFSELSAPAMASPWLQPVNLLLIGVALLVITVMKVTAADKFEMTPLDSLMVLLATLLPFLPDMEVGEINLSLLTAKLIVLFFSFELLLHGYSRRITEAGFLAMWLLSGLVIRAWV